MKYSDRIKSVSYLKTHAAEVIRDLGERREPMIITQNGEARMVIQDVQSYERTQETLALLKILALGNQQIDSGRTHTVKQAFRHVRKGRAAR